MITPNPSYPRFLVWGWVLAAFVLPWFLHPAAGWRDGPEFAVSSWVLGIAHPSGYPLYAALHWFVEQFPIADVILRNHMASTAASLSASVALYHVALSFLSLWRKNSQVEKHDSYIAGFISLAWLMLPPQLENAIQSEAYALHALLGFVVWKFLFDFMHTCEVRRYVLAAFLAGMGVANHVTMGFMLLPLVCALACVQELKVAFRTAAAGIVAGLAGLSVYFFLPVRSLNNPSFDWGDTEHWPRFWHHVLDRKDASTHFESLGDPTPFLQNNIIEQWLAMGDWLGAAAMALCLIGWGYMLWKRSWLALGAVLWMVLAFVFFAGWISCTVLTAVLGILLFGLIPWLQALLTMERYHTLARLAAVVLVISVMANAAAASSRFLAKRSSYLPKELVEAELLALPYRASILASLNWFHLRYLADIESLRPDVSIIGLGDIASPQHFKPLQPEQVPLLAYPKNVALPLNGPVQNETIVDFLLELKAANRQRSRFFLELDSGKYLHAFLPSIAPYRGLWGEWLDSTPHVQQCATMRGAVYTALSKAMAEPTLLSDWEAADFLAPSVFGWVLAALSAEPPCPRLALKLLRWWQVWMPATGVVEGAVYNDFGLALHDLGHDQGAGTMFQLAAASSLPEGMLNLGIWHEKHGHPAEALALYQRAFVDLGELKALEHYRTLLRSGKAAAIPAASAERP